MMKALRFHGARDLRVETIDAPRPPERGEVRVRVLQCGICGSDLHEYLAGPILIPTDPHPFTGAKLPQILGHEFSAMVDAVGEGVTAFRGGDRVAIIPHLNKPGEYYARRNLGHISSETGLVGFSWPWGGLGEYATLPQENLVRLPDEVSDEQGALVEPASVALNAVDRGGVFPGCAVLVTGAGPIGALVTMAAAAAGASQIYVYEPNPARRERIAALPGVTALGESPEALLAELQSRTDGGQGVDVVLECAGHEGALAVALDAVKRGGNVVQVGLFVTQPRVDMFKLCEKAVRLIGSWGFPITIGPRVIGLIAAGRFPVETIISGHTTLDRAQAEGFDELTRPGNAKLKILVDLAAG